MRFSSVSQISLKCLNLYYVRYCVTDFFCICRKMAAINVYATSATTENLSRMELLNWVNECLQSNYSKVEELCTGAAYSQFIDLLFPGVVQLKKIKWHTRLEHEYITNFKVMQTAMEQVGADKV